MSATVYAPMVTDPFSSQPPQSPSTLSNEEVRPGTLLHRKLKELLRAVPEDIIIDEWASRGVPSSVAMAFFMSPCDGAVPFFEKAVTPLHKLNVADPATSEFINRCHSRNLAPQISRSIDEYGVDTTIANILQGLEGNQIAATALMRAIRG